MNTNKINQALSQFKYLDQLEEIRHNIVEAEAHERNWEFIDCIEEIDKIIDTLDTFEAEDKAKKFVIERMKMLDWTAMADYEFVQITPEYPIYTFRFDPKYQYDWTIMQEQVVYTEVKRFPDRNVIQEKVVSLKQWNIRVENDQAEESVQSYRWEKKEEPGECFNPIIKKKQKIFKFIR